MVVYKNSDEKKIISKIQEFIHISFLELRNKKFIEIYF